MKTPPLYEQIVEAVRQELLTGKLRPGDALPPVREMAERWGCTPGTVQQAYRELARQGLAISRPGQGTHVGADSAEATARGGGEPLRRATLVNQAEAFLLEMLSAGYTPAEAERAFRAALDRWRTLADQEAPNGPRDATGSARHARGPADAGARLRFAGSHDPAVSLLAAEFETLCAGCTFSISFTGSLGGLIALAEGKADIAGSHLWDAETDTYNVPFVRRLLPGRRVALLTLAHRRFGLLTAPGNPSAVAGLMDLVRPGVTFINRQRGAGTRVWLDAQLQRAGLNERAVSGREREVATHEEVARAVAEGRAVTGLAIQSAALAYGLHFVPLATERYDLVIPSEIWGEERVQAIVGWVKSEAARAALAGLGGYDTTHAGEVIPVE